MPVCQACGAAVDMPYSCNYCGRNHCADHRLPENHGCSGGKPAPQASMAPTAGENSNWTRRAVIGAAGLLALGGAGVAASGSSLVESEPLDTEGTTTELGTFAFNTAGVTTVEWRAYEEQHVELAVTMDDPAADSFRLHHPDSRRIWAQSQLAAGETLTRIFKLPIMETGDWELVVMQGTDTASLQLPVRPDFAVNTFGLNGDTLVLDIANETQSPNLLWKIELKVIQDSIEQKVWEPNMRLMPGENYTTEFEYPFNHYENVELWITGADTTIVKTSFV